MAGEPQRRDGFRRGGLTQNLSRLNGYGAQAEGDQVRHQRAIAADAADRHAAADFLGGAVIGDHLPDQQDLRHAQRGEPAHGQRHGVRRRNSRRRVRHGRRCGCRISGRHVERQRGQLPFAQQFVDMFAFDQEHIAGTQVLNRFNHVGRAIHRHGGAQFLRQAGRTPLSGRVDAAVDADRQRAGRRRRQDDRFVLQHRRRRGRRPVVDAADQCERGGHGAKQLGEM